jgi:hypothetical protein
MQALTQRVIVIYLYNTYLTPTYQFRSNSTAQNLPCAINGSNIVNLQDIKTLRNVSQFWLKLPETACVQSIKPGKLQVGALYFLNAFSWILCSLQRQQAGSVGNSSDRYCRTSFKPRHGLRLTWMTFFCAFLYSLWVKGKVVSPELQSTWWWPSRPKHAAPWQILKRFNFISWFVAWWSANNWKQILTM